MLRQCGTFKMLRIFLYEKIYYLPDACSYTTRAGR